MLPCLATVKLLGQRPRISVSWQHRLFGLRRGLFRGQSAEPDADARAAMENEAAAASSVDSNNPKAWKWNIPKRIWDLMEARNFAQNPRPVHHRIPNFVGASSAAHKPGVRRLR